MVISVCHDSVQVWAYGHEALIFDGFQTCRSCGSNDGLPSQSPARETLLHAKISTRIEVGHIGRHAYQLQSQVNEWKETGNKITWHSLVSTRKALVKAACEDDSLSLSLSLSLSISLSLFLSLSLSLSVCVCVRACVCECERGRKEGKGRGRRDEGGTLGGLCNRCRCIHSGIVLSICSVKHVIL